MRRYFILSGLIPAEPKEKNEAFKILVYNTLEELQNDWPEEEWVEVTDIKDAIPGN